jgi:hypothetical protein
MKNYSAEEGAIYVAGMFYALSASIVQRHQLNLSKDEGNEQQYEGLVDLANRAMAGAVVPCIKSDCDLRINLIDVAMGDVDGLQLTCTPRVFNSEIEARDCEESCAAARAETLANVPDFLRSVNESVAENTSRIDEANAALDRYI